MTEVSAGLRLGSGPGEESGRVLVRRVGLDGHAGTDIAEAALELARMAEGPADLAPYRAHLALLADNDGEGDAETAEDRADALAALLYGKFGYRGDIETYDDLRNANLMRVIDRRCGLPVALGILYLHAARARGWDCVGLAFPGHFLLRLSGEDGDVIVDPFHDGTVVGDEEMLGLLRASTDDETVTLHPAYEEPVSDRMVLLRLQNNIKLRLLRQDRSGEAASVIDGMLLLGPEEPELWREAAIVNAQVGHYGRAIQAAETCLALPTGLMHRQTVGALLQELRLRLN